MSKLLTIPGVGKATAEKLQQGGVEDIDAVADAAIELLVQLTGFYEARAAAIRDAARDLTPSESAQVELVTEAPATDLPAEELPSKPLKTLKKRATRLRKKAKALEKAATKLRKAAKKAKKAGKKNRAKRLKKQAKKASAKAAKKAKKAKKAAKKAS